MRERVRVGIVGDFDARRHSHWATEAALFHAGARLGVLVEPRWLATPSFEANGAVRSLSDLDGVWGAPGSPYASMAGVLRAIEYARRHDLVYLGTCAGFQYALIEFTRNVLGVTDADSAENAPSGDNVVITPVQCAMADGPAGGPRLAGVGVARVVPGTLLEKLCGQVDLRGQYFCSFETNSQFVPRWEHAGLRVGARGSDGEMRALELPDKQFFLATLFQPQLSSSYDEPHPIIEGYLRACLARSGG